MRRFHVLRLVLLCGLGCSQFVSAQEAAPAKNAASPFDDTKANDDAANRRKLGHQIKLAEPQNPEKSLEERLEAKASFQGEEDSLINFAEALGTALDTPIVLASKKLEEAAINADTPMSYRLNNVRVRTGLRLILGDLGLTYVLHENVLVITTPEDAGSQLVTRVYDCRDLLKLPSPIRKTKHVSQATPGSDTPVKVEEKPKEDAGPDGGYTIDDLIDVITSTIAPDSWDEVGGPGSIADFKGLVTINETQEVHEQIENLLNMLHKAGGLEEKVKVSR